MDRYAYRVGDAVFFVGLPSYEGRLLAHATDVFPRVFAVVEAGTTRVLDRADLLAALGAALGDLAARAPELGYRYELGHPHPATGREVFGGGGIGCTYQGRTAIAEAGPGYCRIRGLNGEILRDLRDMQAVRLEGGALLRPRRRKRAHGLVETLQRLAAFLEEQGGTRVEHWVEKAERA